MNATNARPPATAASISGSHGVHAEDDLLQHFCAGERGDHAGDDADQRRSHAFDGRRDARRRRSVHRARCGSRSRGCGRGRCTTARCRCRPTRASARQREHAEQHRAEALRAQRLIEHRIHRPNILDRLLRVDRAHGVAAASRRATSAAPWSARRSSTLPMPAGA